MVLIIFLDMFIYKFSKVISYVKNSNKIPYIKN